MDAASKLSADLEGALAKGSAPERLLAGITDLFFAQSHSAEQIALFDDVLGRLLCKVDTIAKQDLARRLAVSADAPPGVVRQLALDEAPAIASPLLIHALDLAEDALVECARSRSQVHLLAISKRPVVTEPVTDVLVVRGIDMVIRSIAENLGSRFSNAGFGTMVRRADGDDLLTTRIGVRRDLPRHHFLRLLAKASDIARREIEAARGETADDFLRSMVARASAAESVNAPTRGIDYSGALADADALRRAGQLDEAQLRVYAAEGRLEHVTAALSLLCDLPIALIEKAMTQSRPESLLLMAKAIGISASTMRAILAIRLGANASSQAIDQAMSGFERIRRATAEQVMAFHRTRADRA